MIPESIKKLDSYVNDFSGVLFGKTHNNLNQLFLNLDSQSSIQAVTVIFPHRNGQELRDIALEVFNENEIGQKGKNNGLLLIISSEEKKIRIMTGKGLEWLYDERWCREIIEQKLRPLLESGKYEELINLWHQEIIVSRNQKPNHLQGFLKTKKVIASFIIIVSSFIGIPFLSAFAILVSPSITLYLYIFLVALCLIIIFKNRINKGFKYYSLSLILIYSFFFVLPFIIVGYITQKEKIFCEKNPIICEEKKIEKERIFCEKEPQTCIDNRIQYESSEYKKYLEKSRNSNTSGSNSSSSSSSGGGGFSGGGGSTNGAGAGD